MCSFHCDRAVVCIVCNKRLCQVLGDECMTLGAYRVGSNAKIVACAECYQKIGVADGQKQQGVAV
jgi:uncharacterized protein with PIN domain